MLRDPASAARLGRAEAVERRSALPSMAGLDRHMLGCRLLRGKGKLSIERVGFVRVLFSSKLVHKSTNTDLGNTTSTPRGRDIKDKERKVRAGKSQSKRAKGVREPKERQGGVLSETSRRTCIGVETRWTYLQNRE